MREPLIHSHITDTLSETHHLAYESVYCETCGKMLHASNNECMQTWVETGKGNYCLECFGGIGEKTLSNAFALDGEIS